MSVGRQHRFGLILDPWLLSVAVIWGGSFVVYKLVLAHVTPLAVVSVRYGLMAPPLLLVARLLNSKAPVVRGDLRALLYAGLVVQSVQQLGFIAGVNLATAVESALLTSTMPIWTALIAVGMGQERLTRLNWFGVFVGFIGVAMVVFGGKNGANPAGPDRLLGDALLLGAAVLYGYFTVLVKPLVENYGGLQTVAYCYALGAMVIVPVAGRDLIATNWAALTPATWFWLVGYIGALAGVYGFAVWYTSVGRTSPARTAAYQYLVPVVAMAAAAIFLGERPQMLQLAGAAVTLAGLAMARWPAESVAA
ncbi:MAG: DMT family transporter [Armatimonadetes bacterium]|nr:DMT family transporter [Armatimonadota bacterium]